MGERPHYTVSSSSHSDDEEKQILNHTYMQILNAEQMTNHRLLVKLIILQKKTRTLLIVLYYLIKYLCYASYCIALEMEEINYLYLYLYLYVKKPRHILVYATPSRHVPGAVQCTWLHAVHQLPARSVLDTCHDVACCEHPDVVGGP
jgi:hypothetical protein